MNAHCERVIRTIRRELLNHILIMAEGHARQVLKTYGEQSASVGFVGADAGEHRGAEQFRVGDGEASFEGDRAHRDGVPHAFLLNAVAGGVRNAHLVRGGIASGAGDARGCGVGAGGGDGEAPLGGAAQQPVDLVGDGAVSDPQSA
ncbi:MAG TPA: hypothetical protein VFZ92_07570 [Umezawaea sp.]